MGIVYTFLAFVYPKNLLVIKISITYSASRIISSSYLFYWAGIRKGEWMGMAENGICRKHNQCVWRS
ncbi:hypothetical protein HanHA300_Chr02g0067011 [Helianthus annuus]|nr:hypothetical protein HanHA300_Chr02g0067011 [Helianthus annuus]